MGVEMNRASLSGLMSGRGDESCMFQRIIDMSGRGMNKFN